MKKISKKILPILFLTILLAIIFVFSFSFAGNTIASQNKNLFTDQPSTLAENTLSGQFDILAISRDGENIVLGSPTSYYDSQAYAVDWADIERFSISFITDEDDPPPLNAQNPENPQTYNLTLTIRYLKTYLDYNNFSGNEIYTYVYVHPLTSDHQSFASLNYSVVVDNFNAGNAGWGIYQFIVDINGAQATSLYYAVEPTRVVNDPPEIAYEEVPSDNSLHSTYEFYLVNEDDYRYVDPSCLVWYVKGESLDGTLYALLADDLNPDGEKYEEFADCARSLYTRYDRTGAQFTFNDNEISGDWQVWCEYKYHSASEEITPSSSERVEVSTGASFNYLTVVYIVVGIAVASIIIVIVICVIKNKRERVW